MSLLDGVGRYRVDAVLGSGESAVAAVVFLLLAVRAVLAFNDDSDPESTPQPPPQAESSPCAAGRGPFGPAARQLAAVASTAPG